MQKEELLSHLDAQARAAFDEAKQIALARGGVLTPLHLLLTLLEAHVPASDVARHQHLHLLHATLDALAARYPAAAQSVTVPKATQALLAEAHRLAARDGKGQANSTHLLQATLAEASVTELFADGALQQAAHHLLAGLPTQAAEAEATAQNELCRAASATLAFDIPTRPLAGALSLFCTDLAEESRGATVQPFIGREREVMAVLETLCRKLKNNPLLVGKPGVGKSALVAAIALRLCDGNVPARLRGKRILEVSRLRLLADAKFAGEIEERLKQLLEDVKREGDVILFFDEMHTLLGAGSSGTGDVANLLKTSLSKGDITCIGATTLTEYYKYIARDEALARRFSTIIIEEPSSEETRRILIESRAAFEQYHSVKIDDEMIALIIDLADRYLYTRSFPDKAFDLLDKSAAKATLAGEAIVTRECITETLSESTGLPLDLLDEDPAERLNRLEDFLNSLVPGQTRAARDIARVVRIAKLRLELRPEQPDGVFLFVGPEGVGKHETAAALAKFLYGSTNKMIEFDMSQFTEHWSMSRLIGAEPGYVGYGDRSGQLAKAVEDSPHSVLYFRNIDLAHVIVQQFLAETFERGFFTDAEGDKLSLSNTTVVMSLSREGENNKPTPMGFAARRDDDDERRTSTGRLSRELRAGAGLPEALAATVDEVIEFQVLDQKATERIISEKLESLKARLEAAQPVSVKLAPDLPHYFAARLADERKSLAQLERIWQEVIVIPFTQLHLDRQASGARPEVSIRLINGQVEVERI